MAQELVQMNIDVSKLKVSKFNARDQDDEGEGFEELVQNIKLNGLIHPVEVRQKNGQYEVVAGSRRLRAYKELGMKTISVTIRELDDTDAKIDSLNENIVRGNLTEGEKTKHLRSIYNKWNTRQILQYLTTLHNRRSTSGGGKSSTKPQTIHVPEDFEHLCKRVGYKPSAQYGFINRTEHRKSIIESEPILSQNPKIKEYVEREIDRIDVREKTGKKKAETATKQAVHDIRTGALKEDKDTGEVIRIPSKSEKIDEIEVVPSPRRTREEIIDLSKDLYELVTTVKLNMNDIDRAEQQATSTQAVNRMKELATNGLGQRELTALQTAVIPLAKALDRFTDILEDE